MRIIQPLLTTTTGHYDDNAEGVWTFHSIQLNIILDHSMTSILPFLPLFTVAHRILAGLPGLGQPFWIIAWKVITTTHIALRDRK